MRVEWDQFFHPVSIYTIMYNNNKVANTVK